MNEFCNTCPDRVSENCALPPARELRKAARKVALGNLIEGFMALGAAAGPGGYHGSGTSKYLLEAEEAMAKLQEPVEVCIELHQPQTNVVEFKRRAE